MNTVTVTRDMLIWHDDRCGMYKTPQGYVLVEYTTGDARWMGARQAKYFMSLSERGKE